MFIDDLRAARREKGLTRAELAQRIGVTEQMIKRLEQGIGSTVTLVAAMTALDFHLNGIAVGSTLIQQINAKIDKLGWSIAYVARRTGLQRSTVSAVMAGSASVASVLAVLAAVAPKVQRARPARVHWSPDRLGERDSRFTPLHYLNAVVESFGEIDLDPCAHLLSPVVAKRRIMLPEDGLSAAWDARLVYVNPPFSGLLKWINRAADACEQGESETVVMLSPVRTDSATWRDRVAGKAMVGLINGRLKFGAPPGVTGNVTPFSLMTIIWGGSPEALALFAEKVPSTWIR